jgi:gamma-glutamyl hercynylcysteine S-oxide hydrolase
MCRHLAYVGEPLTLQALIIDPPHSLFRQAWEPRFQKHGVVNADGFGAGWFVPGLERPVRYRRAQPIWTDASFRSLAPSIASGHVLAAVRTGTAGFGHDESFAAPFMDDRLLFSLNGRLDDWPRARKALTDRTFEVPEAAAPVDSALLFGLVATHRLAGASLGTALAETVREALTVGGGRLNLLALDHTGAAATTYTDRLFVRESPSGVVLASEPHDDDTDWREIPDGMLVEADGSGVRVTPLTSAS